MTDGLVTDVTGYWDERHRNLGFLRSGGDLGLSETANELFYISRLGQILSLLGMGGVVAGHKVLDAGCGKGWFTMALRALGFDCLGIDPSSSAIAQAQRAGRAAVYRASLRQLPSLPVFDAAICVDVLFHLTDDHDWELSLRAVCRAIRPGGLLIFSDDLRDQSFVLGDYVVHRARDHYDGTLGSAGFAIFEELPYRTPGNPNKFYAARRTAI